jgi:TorA maturation chaperone TorD
MTDTTRLTPHAAWSTLFDALSAGFTYPGRALVDALYSGDFIAVIHEAITALPCRDSLPTTCQALESGIAVIRLDGRLADLESDYIALFDSNHERPPAHPYAHLYIETDHISLLRRLQTLYHDAGIRLKAGEGADQPDHLAVQLEFTAWLHQQLDGTDAVSEAARCEQLNTVVLAMCNELAWVGGFLNAFAVLPAHDFYHPLAGLLTDALTCHVSACSADTLPAR